MTTILFLCVANSARSQMAEGLTRHLFKSDIRVLSAGSIPSTVNPYAIKVLEEVGIDCANHHSKSIDAIDLGRVDIIITLCAEEICPVVPRGAEHLHWPLADPASDDPNIGQYQHLTNFRAIRDEISVRLSKLDMKLT